MKITKVKCDPNNDKWTICMVPKCGPFDHFLQEWILIKLDENQTLLANNSKYKEHMTPEIFQKIAEQKKLTFKTIEDILKSNDEKSNINKFVKKVVKK